MKDIDPTLPEQVRNFLASGAHLESIRLDARGKWTHEGLDFENKRIIALFHRSVRKTEGGTWVLEVGRFVYPIEVDDCGYFVTRVTKSAEKVMLHTTLDQSEVLDPQTLTFVEPDALYCKLAEERKARFIGSAYLSMADEISEEDGVFYFQNFALNDK